MVAFTDRVNYIKDFAANPCEAPLAVYAESAIVPAGNLILGLLTFGLDDVIRGAVRPKPLRGLARPGFRSGPTGLKPGRGLNKGIPEIGEMIGENLPGVETFKNRIPGAAEKALFVLDGVAQRALYHVMIIDLVTEFLYEWTSLINSLDPAKCDPGAHRGLANTPALTLPPAAGFFPVHWDVIRYETNFTQDIFGGWNPATQTRGTNVIAWVRWLNNSIADRTLTLAVLHQGKRTLGEPKTVPPGGKQTTFIRYADPRGGGVAVQVKGAQLGVDIPVDGDLFLWADAVDAKTPGGCYRK